MVERVSVVSAEDRLPLFDDPKDVGDFVEDAETRHGQFKQEAGDEWAEEDRE